MNRAHARAKLVWGLLLIVGAAMGVTVWSGCNDKASSTTPWGNTPTQGGPGVTPPTFTTQPAVLLSSRAKDGRYIVAIDFAGSKAMDKSVPLDERRKYVLEQSIALYTAYAKKEKDDQRVWLMAISVPNRDDYARGDFKNMDELAVFDTVHATATDANKPAAERAGKVEWRKALGE